MLMTNTEKELLKALEKVISTYEYDIEECRKMRGKYCHRCAIIASAIKTVEKIKCKAPVCQKKKKSQK